MKRFLDQLQTITWLSLIDLVWYVLSTAIFGMFFYPQLMNIAQQAMDAVSQNTQSVIAANSFSVSQIELGPYAQALISLILIFIAIASIIGILAEFAKTKILCNKPFWAKTTVIQVVQLAAVIFLSAISQYLIYLNLAYPIIPLWFFVAIIVCIWGVFFWLVANTKARIYAKEKFQISNLWIPLVLITLIYFLASTQNMVIIIFALLIWIAAWNWYQYACVHK